MDISTLSSPSVMEKLNTGDREFASSLIQSYKKWGGLSARQAPWVDKLIERASNTASSKTKQVDVGEFQGVVDLFSKAAEHLKWPKIVLLCQDHEIVISITGPRSKAPGSINIAGEGPWNDRPWYGRVSTSGIWEPSRSTTPEMQKALTGLLSELAADPVGVAKRHGHLTGKCCFCNRKLTDERSTAAGFGPVCADHFGLAEEWKNGR